jgi:hypothetical protein
MGIQNDDCLWNKINDSPQLLFVLTGLDLNALDIIEIGCR